MSADQIVILILLLALAVKFVFFEDKEELRMAEPQSVEQDNSSQLDRRIRRKFAPPLSYANKGCDGYVATLDLTDGISYLIINIPCTEY